MRLIDADQIESELRYAEFDRDKKVGWLEAYRRFMKIIEDAPTVYDIDETVKKLMEKSEDDSCVGCGSLWLSDAIEIVKSKNKEIYHERDFV